MIDAPDLTESGIVSRAIEPGDLPRLQALCERSADYYEAVTAGPPGPSEAHSIYTILPPNRNYDDKFLFGLWIEDDLIGVIDLVRNYPADSVWMVGLVLLDPAWRGRGLGREIVSALLSWMQAKGGTTARIAVRQGYATLGVWEKLGFERVGSVKIGFGTAGPNPFDILARSMRASA
jgi:RimJ/RimL family protein N-acetyltransferase